MPDPLRQQEKQLRRYPCRWRCLFSVPALLPQIIPNFHNRILTPLHAVLYICGYNHPPIHSKRRQHSAGTRESASYTFHPLRVRARLFRARLYKVLYHRLSPPAADRTAPPPAAVTSGRQSPPPETADGGQRTTQHRPGGKRGEESPGAACSPAPALRAVLPNDSPNDSTKRERHQID